MAVYWFRNKELTPEVAKKEILDMAKYQQSNYGTFIDTAVEDTASRLLEGYFHFSQYKIIKNASLEDIIKELAAGKVIIIPLNGKEIGNPYYTPPGPERHNLVIRGYDKEKQEFITNDPGTKRGGGFRYDIQVLYNAWRDYPTGDDKPINNKHEKNIIVIGKN